MNNVEQSPRLALLVDAENIAPDFMRQILPEVFKLGRPIIQYAYGDFSAAALKPWVAFLRENIIEARQVTPALSGKNSADIALVVDAMDLALRGKCDAICVVSSDRDFMALTLYLRREGIDVFGFGKMNADKKYRQSCARYFELKEAASGPKAGVPVLAKVRALATGDEVKQASTTVATSWPVILQEVARLMPKDGWLSLQTLGVTLGSKGIRAKNHGGATWAQVLKQDARFEVRKDNTGRSSVRIVAAMAA